MFLDPDASVEDVFVLTGTPTIARFVLQQRIKFRQKNVTLFKYVYKFVFI